MWEPIAAALVGGGLRAEDHEQQADQALGEEDGCEEDDEDEQDRELGVGDVLGCSKGEVCSSTN